MITVKQYGIALKSITENDLELIRNWRNSNSIVKHMFFQQKINHEDQLEWYRKLDKKHNLYFIYNEQGVIHLKNIDWIKKEAEAGIFTIYQEHSTMNMAAIITLMDFAFHALLFNQLLAKVKKNSSENVAMNIQLGYKIISDENDCITMICKNSEYKIKESVRKWFEKRSKEDSKFSIEISDESNWIKNYIHPSYFR